MSMEKRDDKYLYRTLTRVLILIFALLSVGLLIIPTVITPGHFTPAGYFVATIWWFIFLAGAVWCLRVKCAYRCRTCGMRLPALKPEGKTGYEVRFHCAACDTIWSTGVYDNWRRDALGGYVSVSGVFVNSWEDDTATVNKVRAVCNKCGAWIEGKNLKDAAVLNFSEKHSNSCKSAKTREIIDYIHPSDGRFDSLKKEKMENCVSLSL